MEFIVKDWNPTRQEKLERHSVTTISNRKVCICCDKKIVKNTKCLELFRSKWDKFVNMRLICPDCLKALIYNVDKKILRPKFRWELERVINIEKL